MKRWHVPGHDEGVRRGEKTVDQRGCAARGCAARLCEEAAVGDARRGPVRVATRTLRNALLLVSASRKAPFSATIAKNAGATRTRAALRSVFLGDRRFSKSRGDEPIGARGRACSLELHLAYSTALRAIGRENGGKAREKNAFAARRRIPSFLENVARLVAQLHSRLINTARRSFPSGSRARKYHRRAARDELCVQASGQLLTRERR